MADFFDMIPLYSPVVWECGLANLTLVTTPAAENKTGILSFLAVFDIPNVVITCRDRAGNLLSGAVCSVYASDGSFVADYTSGTDGIISYYGPNSGYIILSHAGMQSQKTYINIPIGGLRMEATLHPQVAVITTSHGIAYNIDPSNTQNSAYL